MLRPFHTCFNERSGSSICSFYRNSSLNSIRLAPSAHGFTKLPCRNTNQFFSYATTHSSIESFHQLKKGPNWLRRSSIVPQGGLFKNSLFGTPHFHAFSNTPSESGDEPEPADEKSTVVNEKQFLLDASKLTVPDDGHKEVQLVSWMVAEGDAINSGDVVCEIETPDYSYDFETKYSGIVASLMIKPNTTITPGTLLCYIAKTEEDVPKIIEFLEHQKTAELHGTVRGKITETTHGVDSVSKNI